MLKIKKNKLNKFVIIGIFYFIILLTISVAYSFFNTKLSIKAKTGMLNSSSDYETSYILQANWNDGTGYNYHFVPTITYLGNKNILSWKLYIKVPYDTEIIGCYSAECIVNGETLVISNTSTNGNLSPDNNSVSIGFQMKTSQANYEYKVIGAAFFTTSNPGTDSGDSGEGSGSEGSGESGGESGGNDKPDGETITDIDYISPILNLSGGWGNTSTYILKVSNNSNSVTISSWTAEITFPVNSSLINLWGGEKNYDETTGKLIMSGPAWSPSLAPETSIEVNIFMETTFPAPYTPTLEKFTGITSSGEKVQTDITIGS